MNTEKPLLSIGTQLLSLLDCERSYLSPMNLFLTDSAKVKISQSRSFIDKIQTRNEPFYGINTGFGILKQKQIPQDQLNQLQTNLILSHAVGVGPKVPDPIVKLMMLIKVNSLAAGYSGIRLSTVEQLISAYNEDFLPIIPSQGSVGASGDLAPLAHMVLPLMGIGDVLFQGTVMPAAAALKKINIQPLALQAKEGLALINGTQLMSGYGVYVLSEAIYLAKMADIIAAMSLEAYQGSIQPFDHRLHATRPFKGQIQVAENIQLLMQQSEILKSHENCPKVQDPYSLRCVPQVHGASRNAFLHIKDILETEINSATDNPLIFDEETVISGGNFHGQPLALPLDYLGIAICELASISERRQYLLLEGPDGLPPLLMRDTGVNSGFMIPQYTSAALVSENKVLSHPASTDTIPTSLGQEDHVSMGSISATKALKILENTQHVLAIELLCAAQALDYRNPKRPGKGVAFAHEVVRKHIQHAEADRLFANDIQKSVSLIKNRSILSAVESTVGTLH